MTNLVVGFIEIKFFYSSQPQYFLLNLPTIRNGRVGHVHTQLQSTTQSKLTDVPPLFNLLMTSCQNNHLQAATQIVLTDFKIATCNSNQQ